MKTMSTVTVTLAVPNQTIYPCTRIGPTTTRFVRLRHGVFLNKLSTSTATYTKEQAPRVINESLRILEWDKLCDSVASFAGTSLGREATKEQLCSLIESYQHSLQLLNETNAAVEMHKYGVALDFTGIDLSLVKSAIQHSRRGFPVHGDEALAVVALLKFAEALQYKLKAAIKEDADWYQRFMPLTEMIMELVIARSLISFVQQVIDEGGSVKDSASPYLKRSRDQVRLVERKLYQLMESLIRNEMKETSSMEVNNIDGRWCIKSGADIRPNFEGLLLSSGSGAGSILEPISAVPLNDELQQARAVVAKAEADVLLEITEKMRVNLDDIENLYSSMIQLDVINARAKYSLSYGGTCPDLFFPEDNHSGLAAKALDKTSASHPSLGKWTLYLRKASHPLLLQQHRQKLEKALKNVSNATSEIRRRKQQGVSVTHDEETDINISSLQIEVTKLKQAPPVPIDIFVAQKTRVLVITGPNTGGKTICLKTIGLAAMMAKSGVYVLCSEPVKIPWFDSVFADIGDEQSLSQSLSTFSGHLKQISDIISHSTSRSLVLLDEVGAGTNPLEGAALGMSLLESFAEAGALLTIATTHHGELKTLKYSNDAFENACMEFDEVNLRPTYRILWGVPGRSNAINIAERLGLPNAVLNNARELYGAASTEINEVIIDMEKFKQNFHEHVHEAQHYLMLSRDLHENVLMTRRKVMEHGSNERYRKTREISETASIARSILHKKVQQLRASAATQPSQISKSDNSYQHTSSTFNNQHSTSNITENSIATKTAHTDNNIEQPPPERRAELPRVGDMVHVTSLNKRVTVLKVNPSKEEIVVQAGNMKMKLKLADVVT